MNNQDIICIWHLRVSTHFSFTVCQAIWNYAIDCRKLSDVIEVDHLNELEDILVYLLEVHISGAYFYDFWIAGADDSIRLSQLRVLKGCLKSADSNRLSQNCEC